MYLILIVNWNIPLAFFTKENLFGFIRSDMSKTEFCILFVMQRGKYTNTKESLVYDIWSGNKNKEKYYWSFRKVSPYLLNLWSCEKLVFSVMCVCHSIHMEEGGNPHVTTANDAIGQSQVTWGPLSPYRNQPCPYQCPLRSPHRHPLVLITQGPPRLHCTGIPDMFKLVHYISWTVGM